MKGSRELKRYVAKNRKRIKACHGDDLWLMRLQTACKKWYNRSAERIQSKVEG